MSWNWWDTCILHMFNKKDLIRLVLRAMNEWNSYELYKSLVLFPCFSPQEPSVLECTSCIQWTYVEHVVFANVSPDCRNTVAAFTQSGSVAEHTILILKHVGSVFWRLAPACVSLRSLIQSQMAGGIRHPSLPCWAWLLPKWWWYAITDSDTHPASISCSLPFNILIFLYTASAACLE